MPEIVVFGQRIALSGNWTFWAYPDESGGYSPYPQLEPVSPEGGGTSWENGLYEVHNALCVSPQDAAKSISNTIMSTDDSGSTNNWTKYEYGTTIVRTGTQFGAHNNKIYTDWSPTSVNVGAPPLSPDIVAGLIHSHPLKSSHGDNLEGRYPSEEDIDRLVQLVNDGVYPSTASFYILDAFGVTREFPYSTINNYRNANMSRDQRLNGVALPSGITTANCVQL